MDRWVYAIVKGDVSYPMLWIDTGDAARNEQILFALRDWD